MKSNINTFKLNESSLGVLRVIWDEWDSNAVRLLAWLRISFCPKWIIWLKSPSSPCLALSLSSPMPYFPPIPSPTLLPRNPTNTRFLFIPSYNKLSKNILTNSAKSARLAQSVERVTLTLLNRSSQGCGFDPRVGLNPQIPIFCSLFSHLYSSMASIFLEDYFGKFLHIG